MSLSETTRKMILVIGVASLVFIVGGALYYQLFSTLPFIKGILPFALGVLIGAALNVMKVIMLERTAKRAVRMESQKAGNMIGLQYLLRFLLTGLVLIASVFIPFINLWGVAIGILTLPVSAFTMKFFVHDEEPDEKVYKNE